MVLFISGHKLLPFIYSGKTVVSVVQDVELNCAVDTYEVVTCE